jgi:hypothetical protein
MYTAPAEAVIAIEEALATICPDPTKGTGQGSWLCPATSEIDFLGDLKGIVDLDADVANGAFDPMACWP